MSKTQEIKECGQASDSTDNKKLADITTNPTGEIETATEALENKGEYQTDDVDCHLNSNFMMICDTSIEDFGLPLKIFTGGNLCHPYVSLAYLDTLTQPSVHGYMIGATNDLFIQKKGLADVIIEIEKDRFEVHDPDLRKA